MRTTPTICALVASCLAPSAAFAQHFAFERTLQAEGATTLDVSTVRGKIEVAAGQPGRIVVEGSATVRAGLNVPPNAIELARQVAAAPPIEQSGSLVTLKVPRDADVQRAVTVSYRVRVPPKTEVRTASESGETSIHGISAAVAIRTQSGAIGIEQLSGAVEIVTGSGTVTAGAIAGPLSVKTSSSAFSGTGLGSSLRARTQSGRVEAAFEGTGDVDVETGSSAVTLRGVHGGVTVNTRSGQLTIDGVPLRDWSAATSSSSVNLTMPAGSGFRLDAASRSGDVTLDGMQLAGTATKHAATGQVGKGEATVRVRTGSGAIRVAASDR